METRQEHDIHSAVTSHLLSQSTNHLPVCLLVPVSMYVNLPSDQRTVTYLSHKTTRPNWSAHISSFLSKSYVTYTVYILIITTPTNLCTGQNIVVSCYYNTPACVGTEVPSSGGLSIQRNVGPTRLSLIMET